MAAVLFVRPQGLFPARGWMSASRDCAPSRWRSSRWPDRLCRWLLQALGQLLPQPGQPHPDLRAGRDQPQPGARLRRAWSPSATPRSSGLGAYVVGILVARACRAPGSQPARDDRRLRRSLASLIGAISLRTRGVYFIMITLAFAQMMYYLANSMKAYGGDEGLQPPHAAALGVGDSALDLQGRSPSTTSSSPCSRRCRCSALARFVAVALRPRHARRSARTSARTRRSAFRSTATSWPASSIAGALGGLAGALLRQPEAATSTRTCCTGRSPAR